MTLSHPERLPRCAIDETGFIMETEPKIPELIAYSAGPMFMKRLFAVAVLLSHVVSGSGAVLEPPDLLTPTPASPSVSPTPSPALAGPRIQFATPVFDFGKLAAGDSVRHNFVFTNTGGSVLEINQVKPGCGCTTAGTWDRRVEPGKTGTIPIQFNATTTSGSVWKSILVNCNDVTQSNVFLQIKGTIWTPVSITPASAYFNLTSEATTNDTRILKIVSNLDEPLTLEEPVTTNQAFSATLTPLVAGKEYELKVTARPELITGYVNSSVTLKTSAAKVPLLKIPVIAVVQPAVSVVPSIVMLPASPSAATAPPSVMIRNIGSKPLVLSEPAVNLNGAELDVQELQTGKVFRLTLKIPSDVQVPPGQRFEASIKSNHPKFPVIKVPIVAAARPVARTAQRQTLQPTPIQPGAPAPSTPSAPIPTILGPVPAQK